MTDATASDLHPAQPAATAKLESPLRAARYADLDAIHPRLMEAIETSPFYNDEFKAYEKNRLSKGWLAGLVEADPWHVAIMQQNGEPSGFMISGPELGTLWLYWTYVFPERRKSSLALTSMRAFLAHWDNNRFHKVATYTRPGNDAALAIMKRYRWTLITKLDTHIFGEDYLLFEHPLAKTIPGYDHGANLGRLAQLRRTAKRLIGR